MEILVYSEKSSDWKEIAKWLSLDWNVIIQTWKAFTKWIDGNNITVFWWAWHFYSLKTPKALWFEYSLKSLPLLPDYIEYWEDNSFEHKKALLNNAINLLKNTKFDILVYAWDAGREWLAILDC
jgi:DNA topoisomerase IA